VISREKLLGAVWHYNAILSTRTVDRHVKTDRFFWEDMGVSAIQRS
jgi:DNA-binding response OmpR family regulator